MNISNDDIDKLFSDNFKEFDVQPSEKEWANIASKFNRAAFWRFHFGGFNIYYLAVLLASAGMMVWFGIANVKLTRHVNALQDSLQMYINTDNPEEPVNIYDSISHSEPLSSDTIINKPANNKDTAGKVKKSQIIKIPKLDTVNNIAVKPTIAAMDTIKEEIQEPDTITSTADSVKTVIRPKVKKYVRRMNIVKPKAVVDHDTLHVTKSKSKQ